jgi:hypothetical protein
VDEGGGGVPRLNLLAENGHDAVAVLVEERLAEVSGVDGLEHLLAEGADIVEICECYQRLLVFGGLRKLTELERVYGLRLYGA